jgi:hypothetical protein
VGMMKGMNLLKPGRERSSLPSFLSPTRRLYVDLAIFASQNRKGFNFLSILRWYYTVNINELQESNRKKLDFAAGKEKN